MNKKEEHTAAKSMGDILTSTMQRAYEEKRNFLYGWERDGLQWLIRYQDRNPKNSVGNLWMAHFLELNKEAILSDGIMDFNLRAHDERRARSASSNREGGE